MGRLFRFTSLIVALIVTLSCGDKKNSYPLRKADAAGAGDFAKKTDAIKKALGDGPCLRIDILTKELAKLKDDKIIIYSYNMQTGQVNPTADRSKRIFEPDQDWLLRTHTFYNAKTAGFFFEQIQAKDLHHSLHNYLLPSVVDEKCESVTFNNDPENSWTVIRKSPNSLWLQNKNSPTNIHRYLYDGESKLYVDVVTGETVGYCGRERSEVLSSYVVTRQQTGKLEMDYEFASLIAGLIDEPEELTKALNLEDSKNKNTPDEVSLMPKTLESIYQMVRNEEVSAPPACDP